MEMEIITMTQMEYHGYLALAFGISFCGIFAGMVLHQFFCNLKRNLKQEFGMVYRMPLKGKRG